MDVEYYSFKELIERWKVKKDEIHQFIANEELVPSIFVEKNSNIKAFKYKYYDGKNLPPIVYLQFSIKKIKEGLYEEGLNEIDDDMYGWHYLVKPTMTGSKRYYFETSVKSLDKKSDEGVLFRHYADKKNKHFDSIKFDEKFIEEYAEFGDELVDEFETKYKIVISAEKNKSQHKRKENNLLRLVLALAYALDKNVDRDAPYSIATMLTRRLDNTTVDIKTIAAYIRSAIDLKKRDDNPN